MLVQVNIESTPKNEIKNNIHTLIAVENNHNCNTLASKSKIRK